MLNINMGNDNLEIKTIDKNSFKNIYSIYSASDFKYATGVFESMEYARFMDEISRFIQKKDVFFLDICLPQGEPIGLIKGSVIEKNRLLWINSLVINTPYQKKGYGRMATLLLESFFKQKYLVEKIYLSVFKSNKAGMDFWSECGYEFCDGLPGMGAGNIGEFAQIMRKLL